MYQGESFELKEGSHRKPVRAVVQKWRGISGFRQAEKWPTMRGFKQAEKWRGLSGFRQVKDQAALRTRRSGLMAQIGRRQAKPLQ
uniref:Uncharacterized protein n=1 Tax=Anguilla anguilla TaxID=7936 RepID=A0A0E9W8C6_ANGAN